MQPLLFGILNCTPDSFSDGGQFNSLARAQDQVESLIAGGADVIDVGGEASGPGSACIGIAEEWRRVGAVLEALQGSVTPRSIDTYHAEIARRAIASGAQVVNDVSGGMDPEMFDVIAASGVRYVCMFSCWTAPHEYSPLETAGIEKRIVEFFSEKIDALLASGVTREQIVLDPGMGGFLSADPEASLRVLANLSMFSQFELPLLIGISRKRFLKTLPGVSTCSIDQFSALVARAALQSCSKSDAISLRVHDPAVHREVFQDTALDPAIYSAIQSCIEERVYE